MSTTPPPVAPPPPSAPASSSGVSLGPGQIIALAGAAVVALSTLLNWLDFEGETASAHNVPAQFLLDTEDADKGGLGVGWLLIILAVVVLVGVFLAQVRWLAVVGGAAAVVVVIRFIMQLNSALDEANDAREAAGVETLGLMDVMTFWPFLTLAGAGAAIVGGVIALRQP